MRIYHNDHEHEVQIIDDGTLDTVLEIDGHEVRYAEADRSKRGVIRGSWIIKATREACNDDLLGER